MFWRLPISSPLPLRAVAASSSNKNWRQRVPGLAATAFHLRLNLKGGHRACCGR